MHFGARRRAIRKFGRLFSVAVCKGRGRTAVIIVSQQAQLFFNVMLQELPWQLQPTDWTETCLLISSPGSFSGVVAVLPTSLRHLRSFCVTCRVLLASFGDVRLLTA